jgi:hypothetical protein
MKKLFSLPMVRRHITCVFLGIGFGFLCAYLASKGSSEMLGDSNFWGSALMWNIVFNRFLSGVMISLVGVFTIHPFFGFRLFPWLRGFFIGGFVSLDIAIGSLMSPVSSEMAFQIFWMTILAGAIYGMIIDVTATKIGGEGEKLLKRL